MALTPTGPALQLFLVSVILLTISWVVVPLRVFVRIRIRSLGLDDWLMITGLIFFTVACQATITSSFNGVGTDESLITDYYDRQGRMWFMFFQFFYVLSTVPIKASICVSLCRITPKKLYRYILYAVIALSTVACLVTDIAVLTWCKPISATWDKSTGTCADASVIENVSFFISAISIITDWTCAILPAFILWDVQLRFRIKASVAVVLGLGVVASSATFVRLRYLLAYGSEENYLLNIAHIATWSITESGLGVIAGSMPQLRPLMKYVPWLRSTVDKSSTGGGTKLGKTAQSHKMTPIRFKSRGINTTIEGGGGEWDRLSDNESQRNMINMHKITVTTDVVQRDDTYAQFDKDNGLEFDAPPNR